MIVDSDFASMLVLSRRAIHRLPISAASPSSALPYTSGFRLRPPRSGQTISTKDVVGEELWGGPIGDGRTQVQRWTTMQIIDHQTRRCGVTSATVGK